MRCPVRSGELFAALSHATDLGTGQATEHGLRSCLLALEIAQRAGLDGEALEDAYYLGLPCEGLWFVFERWDGKGMPAGVAGEEIPVAARILHAARDAVAFATAGGAEMVVAMADRCASKSLDPDMALLLRDQAAELFGSVGAVDAWEEVVAAEPPDRHRPRSLNDHAPPLATPPRQGRAVSRQRGQRHDRPGLRGIDLIGLLPVPGW